MKAIPRSDCIDVTLQKISHSFRLISHWKVNLSQNEITPPVTFFEASRLITFQFPRGLQWHSDLNVILFLFWIVFANCNGASIFVSNESISYQVTRRTLIISSWYIAASKVVWWYFTDNSFWNLECVDTSIFAILERNSQVNVKST